MKMNMGDNEILISYRTAKNQKAQIDVLADLNECTRTEMAQWLADHGEKVDGRALRYAKKQEKMEEPAVEETNAEEPVLEELEEFVDEPEEIIIDDESIPLCILDPDVAYSVAEFIDCNLFEAIRKDTEWDSLRALKNILHAYELMCEVSGYRGATEDDR